MTPRESEEMSTDGDHIIPEVRADQTMSVLAATISLAINSFGKADDLTKSHALFAVFVYQLASFSKEPATIAELLRCVAAEMDMKAANAEGHATSTATATAPRGE